MLLFDNTFPTVVCRKDVKRRIASRGAVSFGREQSRELSFSRDPQPGQVLGQKYGGGWRSEEPAIQPQSLLDFFRATFPSAQIICL